MGEKSPAPAADPIGGAGLPKKCCQPFHARARDAEALSQLCAITIKSSGPFPSEDLVEYAKTLMRDPRVGAQFLRLILEEPKARKKKRKVEPAGQS